MKFRSGLVMAALILIGSGRAQAQNKLTPAPKDTLAPADLVLDYFSCIRSNLHPCT